LHFYHNIKKNKTTQNALKRVYVGTINKSISAVLKKLSDAIGADL